MDQGSINNNIDRMKESTTISEHKCYYNYMLFAKGEVPKMTHDILNTVMYLPYMRRKHWKNKYVQIKRKTGDGTTSSYIELVKHIYTGCKKLMQVQLPLVNITCKSFGNTCFESHLRLIIILMTSVAIEWSVFINTLKKNDLFQLL